MALAGQLMRLRVSLPAIRSVFLGGAMAHRPATGSTSRLLKNGFAFFSTC